MRTLQIEDRKASPDKVAQEELERDKKKANELLDKQRRKGDDLKEDRRNEKAGNRGISREENIPKTK